ncbi:SAM-dependent methyltransferase [Amycolatopsis jiangsuensis]|uniref:SAM-dependent methyltransferase n=1 Tax=Amycolatopsis jiangsuensis TaxID=1181879 RepID=UPI0028AD738B|nr:SAM-dependent methyltransferase [Amycolatopsis jiangsuensis]
MDNDPVVTAHGRALLETDEQTRYVEGDIFDPRSILNNEVVRAHLDWSRPIARRSRRCITTRANGTSRPRSCASTSTRCRAGPTGSHKLTPRWPASGPRRPECSDRSLSR